MAESLRFNERTKEFVLVSNDQERAEEAGLTLSTSTKGPDGELVWFTDVDYAALGFWDMADARAKTALSSLKRDFEASRARESNFDPPVPRGLELFQYQRAGIQYAASRPHSLIGDSMGLGKAQPLDALIATPVGWRYMGSIQVGDFVLNSEGSPVRVKGVYPQGIKPCFRVTFRDGTSTRCCDEHLWAVKDGNRRARGRDWAVKSLREISDRGLQTPGGGNKWSTPLAGPLSFSGEWKSVIPPYLMGVLLGDGYTKTKKPCFSTPDQDYWIVSRVQSEMPPGSWLSENRHPDCPQYYLCGGNRAHKPNPFAEALAEDGLNVASSDKFIPAWALVSRAEYRWGLLNGLMDTDGSCVKNRTTFHTKSPCLAEDVAALVRSLGGVAIVRWYDRTQEDKGWEAQVNVKLLRNPFFLPRKAQGWSPAKRNKPSKFIESVTEIEPVSQQCISVDSDDGLYVTDQGIVTHNTAQAIVLGNYFGYEKVLIVCPGSIRLNWRREVMRWSTLRRKTTYPILRSADGVNPYANFVIVSYDLLRNPGIHAALMRMRWDMVILDEAHYLKSMSAKRAQAVFGGGLGQFKMNGIVQNAERVTALTGTPLPNRPRECFGASVKVLTDSGWKPIIDVCKGDKLWDGVEWVSHCGLIDQGERPTMNLKGIAVTEDHLFRGSNTWVSAREAGQSTDTWSRILATGSENLPSQDFYGAQPEQLLTSLSSATATTQSSKPPFSGYELAGPLSAGLAALGKGLGRLIGSTLRLALTRLKGTEYLNAFRAPLAGATTQGTGILNTTAVAGSKCATRGVNAGTRRLGIWQRSRIRTTQADSLTASITRATTSPVMSGGLPESRTCETGEPREKCSSELTISNRKTQSLEPVYDIANAGPRRRFTVLSEDGPVIAHNCYTLARALNWESIDWASYDAFCYRFNPSAQMKTKHVLEMKGRLPELQARLRCNFMVRRLKEDVLKELPDKRYELAYLEKTGPIKKVLQKEKLIDFTLEDLENPFSEIWGQVSTVRREMGEAKAPQVVHHVKHLLDTVEVPKLVMFSYHKSVMDYLKKELSRYGVVEVRGGISTERKQQAVDAFVNDPDCRIFSGQLIAAGTGIDGLQKVCELTLITEPDWVPGNNDQAIDRLHRIGQHGNVIAQFAVVEGSLDERVLSSMFGKTQTIHASLDGGY